MHLCEVAKDRRVSLGIRLLADLRTFFGAAHAADVLYSKTIIDRLVQLGSLSRRQIASLTGVAPFNRDSGNFHGKRRIRGGRAHSRTALFLSAMVAIRYNPDIKRFYEPLPKTGSTKRSRSPPASAKSSPL